MFRIKDLREQKGLNMREVARSLDIPYTTYVNYEKGLREPTSEVLILLADFFDSSVDYLIGRSSNNRKVAFPNLPDSTFPESKNIPRIPHVSDSGPLSPEEEQILYKYHHGKLLSDMTEEEITIIKKFRRLDDRGKSSVLNILNHEYDSLPGEIPSPAPKKA